jgi:hypothetical protein
MVDSRPTEDSDPETTDDASVDAEAETAADETGADGSTPAAKAEDATAETPAADEGGGDDEAGDEPSLEELRAEVEAKYDFENFGPEQMAEMTAEEWEAAFDPETWVTGSELLDRLEADVKSRVVSRDVFARVERLDNPDRLVAYSDEGYVVVYPDGTTEGRGTVLRDVEPLVALNSMEEYDPPAMPEGELLPDPMEVPEGSGETGNLLVQIVAAVQLLAGFALLAVYVLSVFQVEPLTGAGPIVLVAGLGFLVIGFLLFLMVANARLSDRFRAEEYRNRLRATGIDSEERPEWLPPEVEWPPAELEAGTDPPSERAEETA